MVRLHLINSHNFLKKTFKTSISDGMDQSRLHAGNGAVITYKQDHLQVRESRRIKTGYRIQIDIRMILRHSDHRAKMITYP